MYRTLLVALSAGLLAMASAGGAVTYTTTHTSGNHDLDSQIVVGDLLSELIGVELPGDNGWHPANPASGDPLDPHGLPALTDDTGALDGLSGLLNDFPLPGWPTKLLEYDLGGSRDIARINILTGNGDADGRVFSTVVVSYSTNGGGNYAELGYFQSDPSGTINSGQWGATLVEIFDDAGDNLISGATHLEFDFYSVDNTLGEMRDPYDGVNPFTGTDDTLTAAFVSPKVYEIDVIEAGAGCAGDVNGDGVTDLTDLAALLAAYGSIPGDPNYDANADFDGSDSIDLTDLAFLLADYGCGQ